MPNRHAKALVSAAPWVTRLQVADSAAKEHEEKAKPSSVAGPSCGGKPEPSRLAPPARDEHMGGREIA